MYMILHAMCIFVPPFATNRTKLNSLVKPAQAVGNTGALQKEDRRTLGSLGTDKSRPFMIQ